MLWRNSLTLLLRLLLIAAFVPVLVDMTFVFPALAEKAMSGQGLAPGEAIVTAGPAVVRFTGLTALSWACLRLWRIAYWRWLGFALGLTACAGVWIDVLI